MQGAAILTAFAPEKWGEYPQIRAEPGERRDTRFGDIIIDPEGKEYRFEMVDLGGYEYPGFTEVTTIQEQGYTEWLAVQAIEDAAVIGFDPTGVDVYLATERPDAPRSRTDLAREIETDAKAAGLRDAGEEYESVLRQYAARPGDDREKGRGG